jgi:dolichol-phosphate mannosyltransferase
MKATLDISIVLPVFNEKDNLEPLVKEIKESLEPLHKTYEIFFIDDGSTDGSSQIMKQLEAEHPQVRVLSFDGNFGQSAAFGVGFQEARGDMVITMDSDRQNDPSDIPKLLETLDNSGADAVCGYRVNRQDTWMKRKTSQFANWVRNKISKDSVRDTGCSLKAFKKEALEKFFYFKGMHRFFPTLVRIAGGKVVEVPVNHRPRTKGVSKYSTRNRLIHPFLDLLAVRWMKDKYLCYKIKENVSS